MSAPNERGVGDDAARRRVVGDMTEPTHEDRADDPVDHDRSDEDRGISDVGLPRPGDGADTDGAPDAAATEAALDAAFPPQDAGRA